MRRVLRKNTPIVLFADNFYMTNKAVRTIERLGKVIIAECKTEEDMIKKIQETKPKVIVSEYFKVSDRILDSSQHLKAIVVWGVGYDHIDIEAASKKGVYVVNTRGSNAESVAEHAFALMLGLSRKLLRTDAFLRKGKWVRREETGIPSELMAQNLYGKTLGIVGLGAVGRQVARIAKSFKMRVLAYDPYISAETAKQRGGESVALGTLLRESDVVTLHVALNETTRGMMSTKELASMKRSSYLINVSRGPVIDEEALIQALEKRKIAGAGLDVFVKEPIGSENPLLKFDNVIVSPHVAGNSKDALKATSLVVSQEVVRILCDELPKNLVNRSQLSKYGFL